MAQNRPILNHKRLAGILPAAILLLAGGLSSVERGNAAPFLQATETATTSATTTAGVSPQVTGTQTPATATPTITTTPGPTGTSTPPATITRPPTQPVFTPLPVSSATPLLSPTAPPPILPGPSAVLPSPSATLVPLPIVTFQFPQRTSTQVLLARPAPVDGGDLPKGSSAFGRVRYLWGQLARFAPLLFIAAVWFGLGVWFVISIVLSRRD